MGVSVLRVRPRGRLGRSLLDARLDGRALRPVYNFMDDHRTSGGVAAPLLPAERVHLTAGATTSFDARSAAALSLVRSARSATSRDASRVVRSADDIRTIVRANVAPRLIHSCFITDDSFARNKVGK